MPRRRRPRPAVTLDPSQDAIEQFAVMLRQSAERERDDRERLRREQQEACVAAQAAVKHAAALVAARRDLDRAIVDARDARRGGSGVAAADDAWRRAKARLIELETGSPPDWAPEGRD